LSEKEPHKNNKSADVKHSTQDAICDVISY